MVRLVSAHVEGESEMSVSERALEVLAERQLNRRTFLFGTLAVGVTVACGTGGSSSTSSKQTIEFWNLFGGGDGARMVELVSGFNKSQSNVQVKPTTLAWGTPYYTKLTTSTIAGKPPDVAIMHLSRMASFAPTGVISAIDEGMMGKHGLSSSDFSARPWENSHSNNKLFAIPLDTHPLVMFYNKTVAGKAGLVGADTLLKPLKGSDAVVAAFKAAMSAGASSGVSIDTQDVNGWRLWYSLYSQLGGKVLSSDGKNLVLDDAKGVQAASFLQGLTQGSKVAPPSADAPSATALFGSQKAGFFLNGEWEVNTFQTNAIPFDMAAFPQFFDNQSTWGDSHSFVIPRQKSPDSNRLDAVMTFLSYVSKNSLTWAKGGHIPAYKPVLTSADYKNLLPEAHYSEAADNVVYDPQGWWSGAAGPMQTNAGAAYQGVLEGHLTPEQGYSQFKSSLQGLMKQKPPA